MELEVEGGGAGEECKDLKQRKARERERKRDDGGSVRGRAQVVALRLRPELLVAGFSLLSFSL